MRVVLLLICLHSLVCHGLVANGDLNLTWSSLASKTNSAVRSVVKAYLPTALRIISEANISSSCERGLMTYVIALQRFNTWAVEMIDATAKIPSGILKGTMMDFGEFYECLNIRVTEMSKSSTKEKEKFRGRYCTVALEWDLMKSAVRRLEDPDYIDSYGEPPELVKQFLKIGKSKARDLKNIFGICIPSVCSQIDLQRLSSTSFRPLGFQATVVDCHIDEPYVWPVHSVVALSALVVLAAVCAVGTTLDIVKRKRKAEDGRDPVTSNTSTVCEHASLRFLEAFSVVASSEKVMNFATDNSQLSCLHGVRFLTATWIMLGHNYFYTDTWFMYSRRYLINTVAIHPKNVSYGVIENFSMAVDTFFFLSGFLLVYSTWQRMMKNKGKLNLLKFFTNKYIRMTPTICFAITLLMLMPVIDTGPLWNSTLNPFVENCQKTWWANFIYVTNFVDVEMSCLEYTWYLAVLMQFHILGVIILMVFYRSRVLGVILGSLISIICAGIVLFQVLWRKLQMPVLNSLKDFESAMEFVNIVYMKPHFHFMCYLIGMVVAYFLLHKENKLCRVHQILGWCCAVVLALFSVYGPYFNDDNRIFIAFYFVTYRPAWALSIGWLIYICCSGSGGIVNRLLSYKLMYPLSQLSFVMYIVHPVIMIYKASRLRERTYFGHSEQVFTFFSVLLPSILLAFIGCVTVEIPFQKLYNIISEGRVPEKKVKNQVENTEDNCIVMNITNVQ